MRFAMMVGTVLVVVGLGGGLRAQGVPPRGGEFQARLLQRFDANRNGRLDPEESLKAREEFRMRVGGQGFDREAMLQRFDKNGNGQLEPEEREEARKLFAQRGGGRGVMGWENAPERQPRLNQQKLLERFDANQDGKLDAGERRQAMEAARKLQGLPGAP
jgi:Ca2+-binding EF-hand superfamily protein